MSSVFRLLNETLAIVISNGFPNVSVGVRNQLIKNLNKIDNDVKDTLVEIAIHEGITQRRLDKIEYDLRVLKNKSELNEVEKNLKRGNNI